MKKKNVVLCCIITTLYLLFNVVISDAYSDAEDEFSSLLSKYNTENVIVENGISLRMGEELDLSSTHGWEASNKNVVKIDKNGIVYPVNSGTVFLSNEINGNVHIIEVYVPETTRKMNLNTKSQSVDRDYYKVFVDAGHGGKDSGSSGNGYFEDKINLQIAKKVESKLKSKGIEVKMSRNSDNEYLTLQERAEMANRYEADAFISIHQNSADSKSANGIETFYHTDKGNYKPYASEIQKKVISETKAKDRGVKYANFAVLRETYMASALIECGFISNAEESKKIADPWYQDKIATAITNGIEVYLKNNIKLTEQADGVVYQTHVEDYGWQGWKSNGQLSGTNGESKRLEAIKIKVNNIIPGASISYRTHIEDYGWQNWKYNGEISGTEGLGKRLEGIQIKLENAQGYSVEYRVHVQDYGWQGWVSDGAIAGTVGQSKRLEAVEIRVVKEKTPTIQYRTHIEDYGWQEWKSDGEMSGTSGEAKRLEGIRIKINNIIPGANVKYRTHVQDYGWQEWKPDGEMSGTSGEAKRLEAIEIELENAPGYSVQYRVHIQDLGWQEWKSNGEISGTVGQAKRLEGIEVRVVRS